MSCFDNFISIKGRCDNASPTSGLWLDSIGLTYNQLSDIVQDNYNSVEQFFDEKLFLSTEIIVNQIITHISPSLKTTSIIEGQRLGQYNSNMNLIAGQAGQLKGIYLEVCNDRNFVELFISDLTLFVNQTAQVDLFVYDLFQNKLIDTISVNAIANEQVNVIVNKKYYSDRKTLNLFIGYDSTNTSSYQSTLTTSCGSCQMKVCLNSYLSAQGGKMAIANSKLLSNFYGASDTAGISFNYNINCNHRAWLCSIINVLSLPILYKLASEIYHYATITHRSNDTTLVNAKKMKQQYDDMEFRYREAIDNVLKTMRLPTDSECFHCKEFTRHAIILP